jgi:hypothetical protein
MQTNITNLCSFFVLPLNPGDIGTVFIGTFVDFPADYASVYPGRWNSPPL